MEVQPSHLDLHELHVKIAKDLLELKKSEPTLEHDELTKAMLHLASGTG